MLNKKGQLSDVMSWLIATLAIVAILILFVYASNLFAQKSKVLTAEGSLLENSKEVDLLQTKTFVAFSLASEEQKTKIQNYRGVFENE